MESIVVDVYDDGPMGARIEYQGRIPTYCPGMGGWKKAPKPGHWFTRIKGEMATRIIRAFGHEGYGELTMDSQGIIIGMDPYKDAQGMEKP